MIEVLLKFSAMLKVLGLPFLFLVTLNSRKQLKTLEKYSNHDDDVPGDNFPHVFMSKN